MADHHLEQLERFYDLLRSGVRIDNLLCEYDKLFTHIKSANLMPEHRLGKGRFKRLRDEITPVARFVRHYADLDDEIQFPLDDGPHDCVLKHCISQQQRMIQVTIANGKERYALMRMLNENTCTHGFLGLTDDEPWEVFQEIDPCMHSTEEAVLAMARAIRLCSNNKNNSKSDTLIIEADLLALPKTHWIEMQPTLSEAVRHVAFDHIVDIFLVGRHDLVLQLK